MWSLKGWRVPDLRKGARRSWRPLPPQATPESNQPRRFFSSGLTPPDGITFVHGRGPRIAFTKLGPPTSTGNSLIISAPHSSAVAISLTDAHPGIYAIL